MGLIQDRANPKVAAAMNHVRDRAHAHGKVAGIYADNGELAREYLEAGWQTILLSEDVALFGGTCTEVLRRARA
jgi:2-keto-3-deoxy-L-rhamnonate aldolase RhmA